MHTYIHIYISIFFSQLCSLTGMIWDGKKERLNAWPNSRGNLPPETKCPVSAANPVCYRFSREMNSLFSLIHEIFSP